MSCKFNLHLMALTHSFVLWNLTHMMKNIARWLLLCEKERPIWHQMNQEWLAPSGSYLSNLICTHGYSRCHSQVWFNFELKSYAQILHKHIIISSVWAKPINIIVSTFGSDFQVEFNYKELKSHEVGICCFKSPQELETWIDHVWGWGSLTS